MVNTTNVAFVAYLTSERLSKGYITLQNEDLGTFFIFYINIHRNSLGVTITLMQHLFIEHSI